MGQGWPYEVLSMDVHPRTSQVMPPTPRTLLLACVLCSPWLTVETASFLRASTQVLRNSTGNVNPPLVPVGEFGQIGSDVINGMHMRWAGPDDPHHAAGTFLLLHACGNTCDDWFQLPEEKAIVHAVRKRGFFAVAPQAFTNCWTPYNEGPLVQTALQNFIMGHAVYGLDKKPLYGIGISNGGGMLSYLEVTQGVHFHGHNYIVSSGAAHGQTPGLFSMAKFPPSVFVHMTSDPYAPTPTVQLAENTLKAQHTPVLALEAPPRPLADFLELEDTLGIERSVLAEVVQQIQHWGFAEVREGQQFIKFGHAKLISEHLMIHPKLGPLLAAKYKPVIEELQAIDGVHAPTAVHIEKSLNFLLSRGVSW